MNLRPSKEEYFLNIAWAVAKRGTCRRRNYGAIIVNGDGLIVSTGYSGAPRGTPNCNELGDCLRKRLVIPAGKRYDLCRSVHAEANALINADRKDSIGSTMYVAGLHRGGEKLGADIPCYLCKRLIINACIKSVIIPTVTFSESQTSGHKYKTYGHKEITREEIKSELLLEEEELSISTLGPPPNVETIDPC